MAASAVFFFWRGEKIEFSNPSSNPTPSFSVSPTPLTILPESSNVPPNQKPAENIVIKFPIFNYHHLGPLPANADINRQAFTVAPEMLEEHLIYFRDHGYKIVPVSDLGDYFYTGQPLPPKAGALTFDDGYREHYKNAFPILKKYNAVATFFVPTGWISSSTKPDIMTWEELKEMSAAGMTIASHSISHPNLTKLSDEDLKKQLEESKKIIEEKIGQPCDFLAYPGGSYDARVIDAAKAAGYKSAVGIYKIIEQSPKYLFSVRRFHADDNLESVTDKLKDY